MLSYISFQFPQVPHVFCAFQTRNAGFSENPYAQGNISFEVGDNSENVTKNREQICASFQTNSFTDVLQVHGVTTLFEPAPSLASQASNIQADGMATTQKNHALCVKSADCQPILITNSKGTHILALHCGWKGNKQNYPYIAVKEFCAHYNISPQSLFAVRGPSLSPLAAQFINFDTEWGAEFAEYFSKASQTMDLWTLTKNQLNQAGIPLQQIFSIDLCTYSNPQSFFSYRANNTTGRQGSFIWIK